MKTKDLPGFGSLGKIAYDFDLATCSDEQVMELGNLVFDELVVLVPAECASVSKERYWEVTTMWGNGLISNSLEMLLKKVEREGWTETNQETYSDMMRMTAGLNDLAGMIRVTGIRDETGGRTGMFADGELDWHSNQQGDNRGAAPLVGLQGVEGTKGTRTDFLSTHDAYYDLDPDTQSEVDNLIAIHEFGYDRVSRGTSESQAMITKLSLVPYDGMESPVKSKAPCGKVGMHFPWTSIVGFKGYTNKEYKRLLKHLIDHLWQDKYIYEHNWTDGDIVWMDQIITLHRRPGDDTSKRLLHRLCSNFDKILEQRGLPKFGESGYNAKISSEE
jgi:hypothetical protein